MKPPASERIELATGEWFDVRKATSWYEAPRGSNARGTQRHHEKLYRTRKMAWVLKRWSAPDEAHAKYERVDAGYAVHWLLSNGHRVPVLASDDETGQEEI